MSKQISWKEPDEEIEQTVEGRKGISLKCNIISTISTMTNPIHFFCFLEMFRIIFNHIFNK